METLITDQKYRRVPYLGITKRAEKDVVFRHRLLILILVVTNIILHQPPTREHTNTRHGTHPRRFPPPLAMHLLLLVRGLPPEVPSLRLQRRQGTRRRRGRHVARDLGEGAVLIVLG